MRTINVPFGENALYDLEVKGEITDAVLADICTVLNKDSNSDFQSCDNGEIVEHEFDENGEFVDSFYWSIEVKKIGGRYIVNMFA